jgi:hypothetical protein
VLKTHAQIGEYLAIAFGVLTVWRILIQVAGFMAGSRAIYLIVAIIAIIMLGYQSHLGGVLVYDYGAGTALMAAAPVPSETASPGASATSSELPSVSVPTSSATSMPPASGAPASPGSINSPTPSPTAQPTGAVNM